MMSLVLNAGSSSVKFSLYDGDRAVIEGAIERIGTRKATLAYSDMREASAAGERRSRAVTATTYAQAGAIVEGLIGDARPALVAHRVVHGASRTHAQRITPALVAQLKRLVPLAPLHLPHNIALIEAARRRWDAAHVACFDTAFHAAMPDVARTYAIPQRLARKHGIVRYGFHGIAHEALAREAAARMARPLSSLRMITCQLGSGASLCAVRGGRSVDTTMGYTPLEGLVMGTRSGSIDPAIPLLLAQHERMAPREAMRILEQESGLLALGGSSDVRDLLARGRKGDRKAALALDVFASHVRKGIGAYVATLGRVDAIVLGGGVSRSPEMRARMLSGLEGLGIALDRKRISAGMPARISKGKVEVWAIDADEQAHMLRCARAALRKG